MIDWFRRLNRKRRMLLIWNAMFAIPLVIASYAFATASEFAPAERTLMIAGVWVFAFAGFAFAWRAGK